MADQMCLLIEAVNNARDKIVKHLIRLSTYQSYVYGIAGIVSATSTITGALTVTPAE